MKSANMLTGPQQIEDLHTSNDVALLQLIDHSVEQYTQASVTGRFAASI